MGCPRIPTRSPEPPATCGRMRADPSSPEVPPLPQQRFVRRHCPRHGRPIDRRDRARHSQMLVASGTVAACCTRCTTTPRRRAPGSSSASSHVGWTSELRSTANCSLMPSFPRRPSRTVSNMLAHNPAIRARKATGRDVSGARGRHSPLSATRNPAPGRGWPAPTGARRNPLGGNHGSNATPVRFASDHGHRYGC